MSTTRSVRKLTLAYAVCKDTRGAKYFVFLLFICLDLDY